MPTHGVALDDEEAGLGGAAVVRRRVEPLLLGQLDHGCVLTGQWGGTRGTRVGRDERLGEVRRESLRKAGCAWWTRLAAVAHTHPTISRRQEVLVHALSVLPQEALLLRQPLRRHDTRVDGPAVHVALAPVGCRGGTHRLGRDTLGVPYQIRHPARLVGEVLSTS